MVDNNFSIIYEKQKLFQAFIEKIPLMNLDSLPKDDTEKFIEHIANIVEELGEVLKADKRHKTHRNKYYNKDEKLSELADVFIENINLSIWSGFTAEELLNAVENKIDVNYKRAKSENRF